MVFGFWKTGDLRHEAKIVNEKSVVDLPFPYGKIIVECQRVLSNFMADYTGFSYLDLLKEANISYLPCKGGFQGRFVSEISKLSKHRAHF